MTFAVAGVTPGLTSRSSAEEPAAMEPPTIQDMADGWVQGAGKGWVTVRFETRATGPGRIQSLRADDPALQPADPLDSLDWDDWFS